MNLDEIFNGLLIYGGKKALIKKNENKRKFSSRKKIIHDFLRMCLKKYEICSISFSIDGATSSMKKISKTELIIEENFFK